MLTALSGDKRYLQYITYNDEKGGNTTMCEVLDNAINQGRSEGLSIGRSEGLNEGLSKGYRILIATCKDFNLDYTATASKLQEKYDLSSAETEKTMKLYW